MLAPRSTKGMADYCRRSSSGMDYSGLYGPGVDDAGQAGPGPQGLSIPAVRVADSQPPNLANCESWNCKFEDT